MSAAARLSLPQAWTRQGQVLRSRWHALAPRERRLIQLMVGAVAALLLWMTLLQPALRTLREAPARRLALETQLQQMQRWAGEVKELRATPTLSTEQSTAALKSATERLGTKARLQLQGERAIVTFSGVGPTQLREWLAETRIGARTRPVEAQLTRGAQGFSGSVVLNVGGTP